MRLTRDVTGSFDTAKDSLQRDLVTLQRNYDQLQAQLTSQSKDIVALQELLANQNISIAADGQVSGLASAKNLQTVAHDNTLTGLGTPARPLGVSNAYTSSLTAGPLTLFTLTTSSFFTLNSAPRLLIAGVPSYVIVPVSVTFHSLKITGAGFTNGNNAFQVRYVGGVQPTVIGNTASLGLGNSGVVKAYTQCGITCATTIGSSLAGIGLELFNASADITNNGSGATIVVTVAYYTAPSAGW